MSRAGSGGWSGLRVDEVQQKLQVHSCQDKSLRSIASEVGSECSSSDKDEVSLAQKKELRGLPGSVAATSGCLGMEIGGVRWFPSQVPFCMLINILRIVVQRDAS